MSEGQYIVSARKYRPDNFRSIVGQGAMSETLQRAILGKKLAHAYLFSGPRGVGKTTAARVLAKTINCLNITQEAEACNECESCKAFNEGRSFNVFELDAASNNSVEDIRSLIEQVSISPALGAYKVFIIDEVHMLSTAAFNAFLKTLEEPPKHAIFILATTEKHKVLPTILSRCQVYDFKRITVNDIADHLQYVADSEGITAERQALEIIAEKADGGMRDALSLFDRIASFSNQNITYQEAIDSLNVLDYSYYLKILMTLLSGDFRQMLILLDEILAKGFDAQLIIAGMSSFFRDLLVVQHDATAYLLEKPATISAEYKKAASNCPSAVLFESISTLNGFDRSYKEATNKRLHLELAFLRLIKIFGSEISGGGVNTVQKVTNTEMAPQQIENNIKQADTQKKTPLSSVPIVKKVQKEESSTILKQDNVEKIPVNTDSKVISSTNFIDKLKSSYQPQLVNDTPQIDKNTIGLDDYDEEKLQRLWLKYAQEHLQADKTMIRSVMNSNIPVKEDDGKVRLYLLETEQNFLKEIYQDVKVYLIKELNNRDFDIEFVVKDFEKTYKAASPKERLDEIIKTNPDVKTLIDSLNLSIV